jgi:hypothetical protein
MRKSVMPLFGCPAAWVKNLGVVVPVHCSAGGGSNDSGPISGTPSVGGRSLFSLQVSDSHLTMVTWAAPAFATANVAPSAKTATKTINRLSINPS